MLDHLNLTVKNFEETVDWYKKVFGFALVETGMDEGEPWGVLRKGDSMLCVYQDPERENPRSDAAERFHQIYHFGLRIKDREAWEKTVQREQLRLDWGGVVRYPHSTSWYVTDPTGYKIEVALWDKDQVKFDSASGKLSN